MNAPTIVIPKRAQQIVHNIQNGPLKETLRQYAHMEYNAFRYLSSFKGYVGYSRAKWIKPSQYRTIKDWATKVTHIVLAGCNFADYKFDEMELESVAFVKCDLRNATFWNTKFHHVVFIDCQVTNMILDPPIIWREGHSNVSFLNCKVEEIRVNPRRFGIPGGPEGALLVQFVQAPLPGFHN